MDLTAEQYEELSRVVRTAIRKWGPARHQDIEDVTHDVLLAVCAAQKTIRSPTRLPALVYRAAQNAWLNRCRSRSNYTACLDRYRATMAHAEQALDINADRIAVRAALREVARTDRRAAEALHHRFWLEESFAAIGSALGISNCAAYKLVSRALSKLARSLDGGDVAELQESSSRRMRATVRKRRTRKKLAITE